MLAWQRFSYKTKTHPCATVILNVCRAVPLTSGLVQYLVGCYAHHIEPDEIKNDRNRWKTRPSDFLTETLILALGRVEDDADENDATNCWCKYHNHQGDEEKSACQDMKGGVDDPDDPDFKATSWQPRRRRGDCC